MEFNTVIDWLREALGMPHVGPQPDGIFQVAAAGLATDLVPLQPSQGFLLRASIGKLDAQDADPWLEALLCANLFSDGTGTSVFSVAADGTVLLTRRITLTGIERVPFLRAFERFVRHGRTWQAYLSGADDAEEALASEIVPGLEALPAFGLETTPAIGADDLCTEIANLLDARIQRIPDFDEYRLHLREGLTLHLRFTVQPALIQVVAVLGQGYPVSRGMLLRTLMRSNQGLSENRNPCFALARSARDVVVCKPLRRVARNVALPAVEVAQALHHIARNSQELREQLIGQSLLAG